MSKYIEATLIGYNDLVLINVNCIQSIEEHHDYRVVGKELVTETRDFLFFFTKKIKVMRPKQERYIVGSLIIAKNKHNYYVKELPSGIKTRIQNA